jgi:hypothetical protein
MKKTSQCNYDKKIYIASMSRWTVELQTKNTAHRSASNRKVELTLNRMEESRGRGTVEKIKLNLVLFVNLIFVHATLI